MATKRLTAEQKAAVLKAKKALAAQIARAKKKAPRQLFVTIDSDGDVTSTWTKQKEARAAAQTAEVVMGPYVLAERART